MRKKGITSHLFAYLLSFVLALLKWGLTRTWNILTFWKQERKKPRADRQKIDGYKAMAGLLAIALSLGVAAWYLLGVVTSASATVFAFALSRQHALYVGLALLIVGVNVARLMPNRRKLGLALAAVGALLCAYGLGYLG